MLPVSVSPRAQPRDSRLEGNTMLPSSLSHLPRACGMLVNSAIGTIFHRMSQLARASGMTAPLLQLAQRGVVSPRARGMLAEAVETPTNGRNKKVCAGCWSVLLVTLSPFSTSHLPRACGMLGKMMALPSLSPFVSPRACERDDGGGGGKSFQWNE